MDCRKFLTPGYTTSGHVELYTVGHFHFPHIYYGSNDAAATLPDFLYARLFSQVSVERGMSWEEATHVWAEQNGPDDGFYVQVGES